MRSRKNLIYINCYYIFLIYQTVIQATTHYWTTILSSIQLKWTSSYTLSVNYPLNWVFPTHQLLIHQASSPPPLFGIITHTNVS